MKHWLLFLPEYGKMIESKAAEIISLREKRTTLEQQINQIQLLEENLELQARFLALDNWSAEEILEAKFNWLKHLEKENTQAFEG